jgi:hypothetical protein
MKGTKWKMIAGLVVHFLIGGLLIFAGSMKVLGLFPPEAVEHMGLTRWIQVIGFGEIATAVLLLIPRTSSLGILLASSFWGGAICIHMTHDEPFLFQAGLLVLTWAGAYLRNPATFGSFSGSPAPARKVVEESAPVLQ